MRLMSGSCCSSLSYHFGELCTGGRERMVAAIDSGRRPPLPFLPARSRRALRSAVRRRCVSGSGVVGLSAVIFAGQDGIQGAQQPQNLPKARWNPRWLTGDNNPRAVRAPQSV